VSGVAHISACARITAPRVRAAWTPLTTIASGWAPAWAPATRPCAVLHCSVAASPVLIQHVILLCMFCTWACALAPANRPGTPGFLSRKFF
jgi:hypothetical protein